MRALVMLLIKATYFILLTRLKVRHTHACTHTQRNYRDSLYSVKSLSVITKPHHTFSTSFTVYMIDSTLDTDTVTCHTKHKELN